MVDACFCHQLLRPSVLVLAQAGVPEQYSEEDARAWLARRPAFRSIAITILHDLEDLNSKKLAECGGICISGGNTFNLLNRLRRSGRSDVLLSAVQRGFPVYGMSAGAAIMGHDIAVAASIPEADPNDVGLDDFHALNLANGWNICCHYLPEWAPLLRQEVARSGRNIIAIPDASGVFFDGTAPRVIGPDPVTLLTAEVVMTLPAGSRLNL
ncbi:Type 1 glutamine amidotransferase-like domain-containing protein [Bradyrhizobium lablabi]|uniref:Type 1 glutamine amidotransferase-like domain-containing protein n=1 Tax=Bradyrhizobium lablabi TaxID=722472 RepID=UPI0020128218|nr:Type 1 glutamine amidotransferase-like domain-containing protein [Bradyrhizobium lablabi]